MGTGQPEHRPLVEVLYVRDCPNFAGALALVERVRAELGIDIELRTSLIGDQVAAERARFPGSPTIRVDGRDVEPGSEPPAEISVACRLYRLEHRLAGQPAERWVRDALLAAARADATPDRSSAPPTSVRGEIMGDKQNAARVAWATIKLSQAGQRPVGLDQLATQVGLPAAEAARLLQLTWRERVDLRDGIIRLDATPSGPRRYRVHSGERPVGAGKGCSVDMYLLALALGRPIHAEATCPATGTPITVDITPEGVERIDPPTAVVAVVNLEVDLTLGLDRIDAEVCAQQPFFASAQAASRWLADHPQGRIIPVRSFHVEARRLVDRLEAAPPAIQVT